MTLEEARTRFPPIWTIYDHPSDEPDSFVIRRWWGDVPEPDCALAGTLELARMYAQREGGSVCLKRHAEDDPVIVESWGMSVAIAIILCIGAAVVTLIWKLPEIIAALKGNLFED